MSYLVSTGMTVLNLSLWRSGMRTSHGLWQGDTRLLQNVYFSSRS